MVNSCSTRQAASANCFFATLGLCCTRTKFPWSRNVPNVPDVPNVPHVPNNVPNISGHVPDMWPRSACSGSTLAQASSAQSRSKQGGRGLPPLPCSHLGPRPMLSMHELSLPEPMLSLSMLILATCPEHAQECSEHCSTHSERSARSECSERSWTSGTLFGYTTACTRIDTERHRHGSTLIILLSLIHI